MTSEQNDAVNQYFVHTEAWWGLFDRKIAPPPAAAESAGEKNRHIQALEEANQELKRTIQANEEENKELKKQVDIHEDLKKTQKEQIDLLKIDLATQKRAVTQFQHHNLTWQLFRMRFLCGLLKILSKDSLFLFTNSRAHCLHTAITNFTKITDVHSTADLKAEYTDEEYKKLVIGQLDVLYDLESYMDSCKVYINDAHVLEILELYYNQMTGRDMRQVRKASATIRDAIDAQTLGS